MDTYLILAGVLVLLGRSVAVRLGHPLGDLGCGEEGEHLDGSARPVVGVLWLHYIVFGHVEGRHQTGLLAARGARPPRRLRQRQRRSEWGDQRLVDREGTVDILF